jgi:hypothetical protein
MVLTRTRRACLFVCLRVLAALSGAAACSERAGTSNAPPDGGPEPDAAEASCPRDLPPSCPTPEPSWASDVRPLVDSKCNACHGVGGIEQSRFDFSTYQGVHNLSGSILDNVYRCLMPPPDAGALSVAERRVLLGWLVCAAPNN